MRRAFALPAAALISAACASAPKPTAASLRIGANPPAVVEGRVLDEEGRPAAGVAVRGIPHGADIPWSPWTTTGCDGRFRLSLAAPGDYSFLLGWNGVAVITENPRDPARTEVSVRPGETVSAVELTFLYPEWGSITDSGPADTPSCR